ncbi:hypothetical protein LTR56_005994 [Elasticomyces elasticus]|nr:hypothetical protein LTR56_005994 [Elasticomyces elasticus]KAK3669046.1 hypothetical protein LTR22_000125 [Elasticomyces elasticus]KAK4922656.1 hypothetical protein LTR49_010012 [Elasticomyces elasticus]KAK5760911.1 hypothetical protein LTS12_008915 [Elasticomyces elasticus]
MARLVECKLEVVPMETSPNSEYETVSYCWNDPKKRTNIFLDGKLFRVHASAVQALLRVRLTDRPRVLWIDGICINQQDNNERSAQVHMMGDIYARSSRNLVYLGEADDSTERAFLDIGALTKASRNGSIQLDIVQIRNTDAHSSSVGGFEKLRAFYRRIWFSRLWVLQEVALAPDNRGFCGTFEFNFFPVLAVAEWLYVNAQQLSAYMPVDTRDVAGIVQMHRLVKSKHATHLPGSEPVGTRDVVGIGRWHQPTESKHTAHAQISPFSDLLEISTSYDSTDPRDKLFGILGLLSTETIIDNTILRGVTYNNTAVEVLAAATKAAIFSDANLRVLQNVSHRVDENMEALTIPTWAHKDRRFNWELDAMPLDRYNVAFGGTLQPNAYLMENQDCKALRLRGWQVGMVREIGRAFVHEDFKSIVAADLSLTSAVRFLRSRCDAGGEQDTDQTFWLPILMSPEALLALTDIPEDPRNPDKLTRHMLRQYEDPQKERDRQLTSAINTELAKTCVNRRLMWTWSGRLAIGPTVAKPLDVIVALRGGGTPFLLRPQGDHFVFIGQCYADGIMDEQLLCFRRDKTEERLFDIH